MRCWSEYVYFLVLALPSALAQNGPTLVASGYFADVQIAGDDLPSIVMAPGQLTTLQVVGLKAVNPSKATTIPLPTTLSGLSVTIKESGTISHPVPLLSVSQLGLCTLSSSPSPDCLMTLIAVQIPFDFSFGRPCVGICSVLPTPLTIPVDVVISENGSDSKAFRVNIVHDVIHVVTGCRGSQYSTCATHPDGTLVTPSLPAHAGETVVIYAHGLGYTDPPVKTGDATPTPGPTIALGSHMAVQFDFTANARPWQYRFLDPRYSRQLFRCDSRIRRPHVWVCRTVPSKREAA
jgi:hypothetical protein